VKYDQSSQPAAAYILLAIRTTDPRRMEAKRSAQITEMKRVKSK
jgi:hypothetical protein